MSDLPANQCDGQVSIPPVRRLITLTTNRLRWKPNEEAKTKILAELPHLKRFGSLQHCFLSIAADRLATEHLLPLIHFLK